MTHKRNYRQEQLFLQPVAPWPFLILDNNSSSRMACWTLVITYCFYHGPWQNRHCWLIRGGKLDVGLWMGTVGINSWRRMEWENTGRADWNGGHLWDELETQCNENSQESMRITLVTTPINGGYWAWTDFLSQHFQWREWESTQLENLQPTICTSSKMCWGKGGTDFMGVDNQWLIHLETYIMRGSPSLTLPEAPGPRDWDNPET